MLHSAESISAFSKDFIISSIIIITRCIDEFFRQASIICKEIVNITSPNGLLGVSFLGLIGIMVWLCAGAVSQFLRLIMMLKFDWMVRRHDVLRVFFEKVGSMKSVSDWVYNGVAWFFYSSSKYKK